MNFALCDGSVTTIAVEIDDLVFQQWSTRRNDNGAGGIIHETPLPATPATPADDAPPTAPTSRLGLEAGDYSKAFDMPSGGRNWAAV